MGRKIVNIILIAVFIVLMSQRQHECLDLEDLEAWEHYLISNEIDGEELLIVLKQKCECYEDCY